MASYDLANQSLLPGDRVVYTANTELGFGIIKNITPQKVTLIITDSDFVPVVRNNWGSETSILNRKIYKIN